MQFYVFLFLTLSLALMTFITLWRYEVWWVRGFDFPRLQLGVLALVLLIVKINLLDFSHVSSWILCSITTICIAYQAWWILPYSPFYPQEVKNTSGESNGNSFSILSANVLMTNKNAPALLKLVADKDPDILVTLESDLWWQHQLDQLSEEYPYSAKCPLDNLYGMHVYSRLPLLDMRIQFLIEEDIPSVQAIVVLPCGIHVQAYFLHPAPPSPTENEESKERDAELMVVAKAIAETELPVIVAGDLNDVAWSATTRLFRKISRLLDPRVGRGMFNSFHASIPLFRWPLDHFFHSDHFLLKQIHRLPTIGSDHFPVFLELEYQVAAAKDQEGLSKDSDDEQWAEEKIAKVDS